MDGKMRTVNGSTPMIQAGIRSLNGRAGRLRLITSYKGVMLDDEVRILTWSSDRVVTALPSHRICHAHRGFVRLQSVEGDQEWTAQISALDPHRKEMSLCHLEQAPDRWRKRRGVRVSPLNPTCVQLIGRDWSAEGYLDDISVEGIALHLYGSSADKMLASGAERVLARLHPSPVPDLPELYALVNYASRSTHRGIRLGGRTLLSANYRLQMRSYIQFRIDCIERELDSLCARLLEPRDSKDLYF